MKLQLFIKLFELMVRHSLKLLICMAVVWLAVMGLFLKGKNQTAPQFTSQPQAKFDPPPSEEEEAKKHGEFIRKWSTPEQIGRYLTPRDIFHELKEEVEPVVKIQPDVEKRKFPDDYIVTVKITQVVFPYYYASFIEDAGGNIIGGVNQLDTNTSSFVKAGGKLRDYSVEEVAKEYIKMKGQDDEVVTLEYRKTSMTSDWNSDLMLRLQRKTISVKKGDTFPLQKEDKVIQIQVADITGDTVTIFYDGTKYELKLK